MGSSSFHEFKKQASFFFMDKIKNALLALTDVTSAELVDSRWISMMTFYNESSKASQKVSNLTVEPITKT